MSAHEYESISPHGQTEFTTATTTGTNVNNEWKNDEETDIHDDNVGDVIDFQKCLEKMTNEIEKVYFTKIDDNDDKMIFWCNMHMMNMLCIISNMIEIITSVSLLTYYNNVISFAYVWWPSIEIIRLFILLTLRCFMLLHLDCIVERYELLSKSILISNAIGMVMITICAPIYLSLISQNPIKNVSIIFIIVYSLSITSRIIITVLYIGWYMYRFKASATENKVEYNQVSTEMLRINTHSSQPPTRAIEHKRNNTLETLSSYTPTNSSNNIQKENTGQKEDFQHMHPIDEHDEYDEHTAITSVSDSHTDQFETFKTIITESINDINELEKYKETIIQYFEENEIDYSHFNIEINEFQQTLSKHCGDNSIDPMLRILYEFIKSKLYRLWSAQVVAQWIIEEMNINPCDEKMNDDKQQEIINEIINEGHTGASLDSIEIDDLICLGIEDDKYIQNVLIAIKALKPQSPDESPEISENFETDREKHNPTAIYLEPHEEIKDERKEEQKEERKDVSTIETKKRKRPEKEKQIESKHWDTERIVQHILKIEHLKEYKNLLTDKLSNFNGYNISEIKKKNIKKWGVKNANHRTQIYNQLQKLDVKSVPLSHINAPEIDLSKLYSQTERNRLEKFHLKLDDTVQLETKNRKGVIRYFGPMYKASNSSGIYGSYCSGAYKFGIQLIDTKYGGHNGVLDDIVYFRLNRKTGIFVSSIEIKDRI